MKTKFMIISIILNLHLFIGCNGLKIGTETGNPNNPPAANATPNPADQLASSICYKVNLCASQDYGTCITAVMAQSDIPAELNQAQLTNLQAIKSALNNNTLKVNSTESSACMESINSMNCNSSHFSSLLNQGDYSQVHLMLQESLSCRSFFL